MSASFIDRLGGALIAPFFAIYYILHFMEKTNAIIKDGFTPDEKTFTDYCSNYLAIALSASTDFVPRLTSEA